MPRHKLTPVDRRRGQAKGAETKRERREAAEQEARAKLNDAADQAVETLIAELKAEEATVRIRAAAQILDRAWGRPRQALEHHGHVEVLTPPAPDFDARPVLQGLVDVGLIQPGPAGTVLNGD
jgi:hypothetical protein